MGFLDSLRRALGGESSRATDARLNQAWNLDDTDDNAEVSKPESFHGGAYDRKNWRKKLKLILDELPESRDKWADHIADAHAMGFDPKDIAIWSRDEFAMLVRRMVADRVVTESEHKTLDLARDLLQIPDGEAEQILHNVVAEAEQFFGGTVEGA